jgi:hypothetical protein
MTKVRSVVTVTLSTLALCVVLVSPAGAAPPVGNCSPAFEGPLTFAEILERFPPPPSIPNPEELLAASDLNSDRALCVRPHPGGVRIVVVDNTASVP